MLARQIARFGNTLGLFTIQGLTWVAFALTDTPRLLGAIDKFWNFNLRKGNADEVFTLFADHFAARHEFAQLLLDLPSKDLMKTGQRSEEHTSELQSQFHLISPL